MRSAGSDNAAMVISRRTMYATWLVAVVALAALVLSLFNTCATQDETEDVLSIPIAQRIDNAPTEIKELPTVVDGQVFDSGVISAYWRVFLSNNGDSDLSVIKYDMVLVGASGLVGYSGMVQDLWILENGALSRFELPLTITAGSTEEVYVKAGLMMAPQSYEIFAEQFTDRTGLFLGNVTDYLLSQGTDIYGNKVDTSMPGVYMWQPLGEMQEQLFSISFQTSRGDRVSRIISWYTFSGLREASGL